MKEWMLNRKFDLGKFDWIEDKMETNLNFPSFANGEENQKPNFGFWFSSPLDRACLPNLLPDYKFILYR